MVLVAGKNVKQILLTSLCFVVTTRTASAVYSPTAITANTSFVKAEGTEFRMDSERFYFFGTNAYYLGQPDVLTDDQIVDFFREAGQLGMKVVRYFVFSNGYGFGVKTPDPIQPSLGKWSEQALERVDLIIEQAARNGVRLILTMSNFEPFLGGWQWWVDQVLGPGYDMELFLVHDRIKCAWQAFVTMLLTRHNTLTNITYRDDPTIFALELANEPHTNVLYERERGLTPGRMVLGWLGEMSAFVRSIDSNHMITTGEEGYRADGPTECCTGEQWMNGGFKGVDFVRNAGLHNISFSTVHIYPDNWAIPADEFAWVTPNVIDDRASIAHNNSKPIIMEEFGMKEGYLSSRDILLHDLGFGAVDAGYGGVMVWQCWLVGLQYESSEDYNFRPGEEGTMAMTQLIDWSWQASG